MRRVQVGPGSNSHTPKYDPGKFAPAPSTSGYRRVAHSTGPTSSKSDYTSTQDIGKQMPTTGVDSGYRRINVGKSSSSSSTPSSSSLAPSSDNALADYLDSFSSDPIASLSISKDCEEVVEEEVVEEEVVEEEVVEEEVVEEEVEEEVEEVLELVDENEDNSLALPTSNEKQDREQTIVKSEKKREKREQSTYFSPRFTFLFSHSITCEYWSTKRHEACVGSESSWILGIN